MEETNRLQYSIRELENHTFIIPEYQRGYRWEKEEIEDLINDINEARSKERDAYYLQQIMVKKDEVGNDKYYLIDGQQRLTTILILLTYLEINPKEIYTIKDIDKERENKRETRNDRICKLKDGSEINPKEINEYFYKNAFDVVKKQIKTEKGEFKDYVLNYVKIIWYELGKEDVADKRFLNINTKHIELESSDLVKAELLSKTNSRSREMAKEYDEIERELNTNDFWYFISNKEEISRMNKLLDLNLKRLNIGTKENDNKTSKHTLYNKYKELIYKENSNERNFGDVWEQISETFKIIKELYNKVELYNLVGYLVATTDEPTRVVGELIRDYENEEHGTKTEFEKSIYKRILKDIDKKEKEDKKWILQNAEDIEDVKRILMNEDLYSYEGNEAKKRLKKVLLLHNILTLNVADNKEKFPFEIYYDKDWDLEHIHPQTEKTDKKKFSKEEALDYRNYLRICAVNQTKNNEYDKLTDILKRIDSLKEDGIKSKGDKILEEIGYSNNLNNKEDCINNLVLLDAKTNREYQNTLFMRKKEKIIEKNTFIPICTQKVFLRGYKESKVDEKKNENKTGENELIQFFEWNNKDAENYLTDIASKIYSIKEALDEGK